MAGQEARRRERREGGGREEVKDSIQKGEKEKKKKHVTCMYSSLTHSLPHSLCTHSVLTLYSLTLLLTALNRPP